MSSEQAPLSPPPLTEEDGRLALDLLLLTRAQCREARREALSHVAQALWAALVCAAYLDGAMARRALHLARLNYIEARAYTRQLGTLALCVAELLR